MIAESPTGAIFSPCKKYRYILWRRWSSLILTKGKIVFIGLNPSTADEYFDDATIRRCRKFSEVWGYGEMVMLNLFAYRATNPAEMKKEIAPVGEGGFKNDSIIIRECKEAQLIVACWGTQGRYLNRDKEVIETLKSNGIELHHLGLTKDGYPKHPLYLKSTTKPILWETYSSHKIEGDSNASTR